MKVMTLNDMAKQVIALYTERMELIEKLNGSIHNIDSDDFESDYETLREIDSRLGLYSIEMAKIITNSLRGKSC